MMLDPILIPVDGVPLRRVNLPVPAQSSLIASQNGGHPDVQALFGGPLANARTRTGNDTRVPGAQSCCSGTPPVAARLSARADGRHTRRGFADGAGMAPCGVG